ncbi:MAG: hypothetical protein WC799_07405 [Desulfobacteraceae bacterium]|jgi:hypothetical protein
MTEDRKDVKIDASFILRADWIWLFTWSRRAALGTFLPSATWRSQTGEDIYFTVCLPLNWNFHQVNLKS